jgi:hypothetical protein
MLAMATIQDHAQLELPLAQKILCRRCSGAGEVYYARTGAEVVGGKRIKCPECDGHGEIDLTAQLFGSIFYLSANALANAKQPVP